ncbi:MAG: glycosyltransferase, partial [Anaerolineae bacterium]|nr:glycosyltransferase [Anaerolineae bacterium]
MTQTSEEIIALIPAYNEVRYIGDVVRRTLAHVPVVVIDDGSSDGTGAAAAMAGAKVLVHPVNQGKGAALNTGFDYAVQRGVAAVIT